MALDIDQMMIDELKRRWPDMSEEERQRRIDVLLSGMRQMTGELDRVMTAELSESGAIGQLRDSVGALSAALESVAPWMTDKQ